MRWNNAARAGRPRPATGPRLLLGLALALALFPPARAGPAGDPPIVIAHRGASGYLPEHTLAGKALAYAMGADYLEQDLVLTRDGAVIVLHDLTLERVTDVAEAFPGRARDDGRFYAIDFSLAEIRRLRVGSALARDGAGPEYPGRFPPGLSRFRIPTLAEEIELIQGLNHAVGREVGIYPELKAPWFHHRHGHDLARAALTVLKRYGYTGRDRRIFLQSFDANELRRLHDNLLAEFAMDIPLVQLIAPTRWKLTYEQVDGVWRPYDTGWMLRPDGMRRIAGYADGVGAWMPMVLDDGANPAAPAETPLVRRAHAAGLSVHVYTLRADPGRVPDYAADFEALVDWFLRRAGVDGVFTDFPDRAARVRDRLFVQ